MYCTIVLLYDSANVYIVSLFHVGWFSYMLMSSTVTILAFSFHSALSIVFCLWRDFPAEKHFEALLTTPKLSLNVQRQELERNAEYCEFFPTSANSY